jgi:glycosyltransferase involved in cell wall biosynthesis
MPHDEYEILVVDGESTDKTREIVAEYEKKYPLIKLIPNPKKITPAAFNLGIRHAKGKYVIVIGAHASYSEGYVARCAAYVERDGIQYGGGIIDTVPRTSGFMARAICLTITHPFGVGNSLMRTGSTEPIEADTAAMGCYPKDLFEKIGYFNENLKHSQDIELNRRIKREGGRIMVYPDLICTYYARSELWDVITYTIKNGRWAILPFIWVESPVALRHLVPLFFALYLLLGPLFCLAFPVLWFGYFGVMVLYLSLATKASIEVCRRENNWTYLPCLPILFFLHHLCYGIGSIWGVLQVLTSPAFYKRINGARP